MYDDNPSAGKYYDDEDSKKSTGKFFKTAHPYLTAGACILLICLTVTFVVTGIIYFRDADESNDTLEDLFDDVFRVNKARTKISFNVPDDFIVQSQSHFNGPMVIDPQPFAPDYFGQSSTISLSEFNSPDSESSASSPDSDVVIFKRELPAVLDFDDAATQQRIARDTYIPGVSYALDVRGLIAGQLVSREIKTAATGSDVTINPGDVVGLMPDGTVKPGYGSRLIEDITTMTTNKPIASTMFGTSNTVLQLYMNDTNFLIARKGVLNATTGEITVYPLEFAVDGRAYVSSTPSSFAACSVQVTNASDPAGGALPAGNNTAFIVYTDPITGQPVGVLCDFTSNTAPICSALQYIDNTTVVPSIQSVWCHPVPDYDEGANRYKQQTLVAIAYTNRTTVGNVQVFVRGGYLNDRRVRPLHPTSIVGINSGTTSGVFIEGIACGNTSALAYVFTPGFNVARLHPIDEAHFALAFGGDSAGSELNLEILSIDYDTNGVIASEECTRNVYSRNILNTGASFFSWYSAMGEPIETSDGPMRYFSVSIDGVEVRGLQVAYTSEEIPTTQDDDDNPYYDWTPGTSVVTIGTTIVVTVTTTANATLSNYYNFNLVAAAETTKNQYTAATNLGQTGLAVYSKNIGRDIAGTFYTVIKYDATAAIGEVAAVTVIGKPRQLYTDEFLVAAPASRNVFGTPQAASNIDYLGLRTVVSISSWVDYNHQTWGAKLKLAAFQAFTSYLNVRTFSLPQRPYGVALTAPNVNGTLDIQSFGWTNPCLLRATNSLSYGALPVCSFGFTGPVYACPETAIPSVSSGYGIYNTNAWAEQCVQLGTVQSSADGSVLLTPNEWSALDQNV